MDLSVQERRTLLKAARQAIEAHLEGKKPLPSETTPALGQHRGAFVTIRRREEGELRGCVGRMEAEEPLLETVTRMAVAAASADGRFEPVRQAELSDLTLEVSALGPLREVTASEVEVGRHGIFLRCGGRQGVLLPQVAVEHGWDRETFLDRACWKTGLPAGAWRGPEVQILVFTAEVFGEE